MNLEKLKRKEKVYFRFSFFSAALDAAFPTSSNPAAVWGVLREVWLWKWKRGLASTVGLLSAYKTVKLPDDAPLHPNTDAQHRRVCTNTHVHTLVYLHAWQEEEMAFLHLESHKQEVLPAHFR